MPTEPHTGETPVALVLVDDAPMPATAPESSSPGPVPPSFGALLAQAQVLQMMQVEAWLAWQHGVFDELRELCEQWSARAGGGLPINA